jgi:putative FmdB family regulatory protein
MPIYEYACEKCDNIFSVFQSITATAKDTTCPKCSSNDVVKRMSSFSCCSSGGGSAPSFGGSGGFHSPGGG